MNLTTSALALLQQIHLNGCITVIDGDAWPIDEQLALYAQKDGLVTIYNGSAWEPLTTVAITRKGQRAIGVEPDPTAIEILISRIRIAIGSRRPERRI